MSAPLGLSTYAYFWRASDRVPDPLSLETMLRETALAGLDVFQICDHPAIERRSARELAELRALAADLGIALELGTRGTRREVLERHLELALALDARLVRSMWTAGDDRPDAAETERRLRAILPAYSDAGVTLALETYEQVPSRDLVALVETIASPRLGICLDPANTVANLEDPLAVAERCAPYTVDWHVKDFAFTRQEGWVGFSLVGAPLGEGRLDYARVRELVRPEERGVAQVVELWLPWQGDAVATVATERAWTDTTIRYLRSRNP